MLLHLLLVYNQRNYAEPKPIYVGFFSFNFTLQDHILNIARDAFTFIFPKIFLII
jgi:hypothetical protein